MTKFRRRSLTQRIQIVGWVYFTNNVCIETLADLALPHLAKHLDLVLISPQNCGRVQESRAAHFSAEYRRKLEQGEVGYFAQTADSAVGSIWATINRTSRPIVARGYMRLRPSEALLHDGVTGEKFRGMGIGPFMVGGLSVVLLTEHGVRRIVGDVNMRNRPSLRMMEKLGLHASEAALSVSAFGRLIL